MIKNNNGATIVELVVSVSILFVIVTFLFQIILSLKEVYDSAGIRTEMLNKQAVISKMLNNDLRNNKLDMVLKCNSEDTCLALYFQNGDIKNLELIPKTENEPAYFVYGDYKTELVQNSRFGSYSISSETLTNNIGANDSILNIDIPITHPLLKNESYGINIVYQYNSNVAINSNYSVDGIYLAGASRMIWYSSLAFEDPGYFYLDGDQKLVKATTTNDDVLVEYGEINNGLQTITYSSKADPTIRVTRTVEYKKTTENYDYDSSVPYYVFTAPVSGTYKMETWGANGGSTSGGNGGVGAYASGEIFMLANEKMYIYVGGAPSGDNGGYNGGGSITAHQSENGGAAGGGATDIRYFTSVPSSSDLIWNASNGLKSRLMVAAGGGGAKKTINPNCGSTSILGGNGGATTSNAATYNNNYCSGVLWTLTYGANQTTGGTIDIYNSNSKSGTYNAGVFGYASNAEGYDIVSGGGGGYYGGASSGYGSIGTGGSSFVSGCENCVAINSSGNPTDSNTHYTGKAFTNIRMVDGGSVGTTENTTKPVVGNNGYAKINLISIAYGSNLNNINENND